MARKTARQRRQEAAAKVQAQNSVTESLEVDTISDVNSLSWASQTVLKITKVCTWLATWLVLAAFTLVVGFSVIPGVAIGTSIGSGVSINNNAQVFIAFWLVPFLFFCGIVTWLYTRLAKTLHYRLLNRSRKVNRLIEAKLVARSKTPRRSRVADDDTE